MHYRIVASDIPGLPSWSGYTEEDLFIWIQNHYKVVEDEFASNPKFLSLSLEDQRSFQSFCEFLGISTDIGGWPHENASVELSSTDDESSARELRDELAAAKLDLSVRERECEDKLNNYKQVIDKIKFDLSVAFDKDEANQVLIKALQGEVDDLTSIIDRQEKKINYIQTQMHAVQNELEKYYAVGRSQSSLLDFSLEVQNKAIAILLRNLNLGQPV